MKLFKTRKAVGLYLVCMTILHIGLIWNAAPLIRRGYPDFTHMYAAGKIVRAGLRHQLYDDSTQYRIQQEFASGVSIRHGALPYNHPPYEALLFVPFTYLPYVVAFILWDALSVSVLVYLPYLLRQHIPLLHTSSTLFWLLASLGFYPVSVSLLQGQDIILLLLLVCLSFVSLEKKREFAAGAWLALGLFRFHLLLPFVVMMLAQKRWRALGGFFSVGAALVVLSVAMLGGWRGALTYPEYAWNAEVHMGRGIVPADMPNLRGLLDTQTSSFFAKPQVNLLFLAVTVVLLALASYRWRFALQHNLQLSFSVAVILCVLSSYHAFAYDLTLYLLPIALILNYALNTALEESKRVLLFGPIAILYASPLLIVLWLQYGQLNWLALITFLWFWGVVSLPQTLIPAERPRITAP
ncbi:MAG TPA: glycosyltransferase family 87 protein [Terriglobales bacterium]|nr:glycosyltransferase family 87 protein [Terriglobales bacterium]